MIEHIVEPRRLLLTWQATDNGQTRTRFAVGQLEAGESPIFRYFNDDEFFSINGVEFSFVRSLGFVQHPAFNRDSSVHDSGVMEAFLRRIPPRNRSDFARYRAHFKLSGDVKVSDFALLGITEAKLPSDGFALVDPFDDTDNTRELVLEVVGHRHYAAGCDLAASVGESVQLIPEPSNVHDENAVLVAARSQQIGYINKFQCKAFLTWIGEGRVSAVIERLNGEPGHPRVYIFVRVAGRKQSIAA